MHDRRMQRGAATAAILALVCGVVGLVLGPGQIAYCMFFSGSSAGDHTIEPGKPVTIALRAEQNPLRFLAKIEYTKPRRIIHRAVTSYDATLHLGEREIWQHTIRVSETDDDRDGKIKVGTTYTTTSVALFDVETDGDYTFVAQPTSDQDLEVRSLAIQVRANVRAVSTMTAVLGFALIVLAVVMLVVAARGKRHGKRAVPVEADER